VLHALAGDGTLRYSPASVGGKTRTCYRTMKYGETVLTEFHPRARELVDGILAAARQRAFTTEAFRTRTDLVDVPTAVLSAAPANGPLVAPGSGAQCTEQTPRCVAATRPPMRR
jgi:hypothetical protein